VRCIHRPGLLPVAATPGREVKCRAS
jgi:hypothetical protein